jgi:ubiquinol-cytochrome c reductase cytochrome b subunit
VHDLQALGVFLFIFCAVVFFLPEMGGYFLEFANFEEANPLKTPEHIAPVWYFTPFYSVLRAVPDKFWGFVAFAASVAIPFLLPWLDRSPVRSWRYRGNMTRGWLVAFVASFLILGVLGVKAPSDSRTVLTQICTIIYFAFFLLMPWWSAADKVKPVPERVTMDGGIGVVGSLGGLILILALTVIPLKVVGAESAYDCGAVPCDVIEVDPANEESLQRGAGMFMNYCMGCHSLGYQRYNRMARDLDMPEDLVLEQLIHDPDVKVGDLMQNAMSRDLAKVWFGAAPPDLTLVSRARQPEWLYTYLRTFYRDDTRPYGVNNLVFANVGMPHTLLDLQGMQECRSVEHDDEAHAAEAHCDELVVVEPGLMTEEEYDGAIYDLVNFLAYTGEPMRLERERIGKYALLFVLVFFALAWLLNREYWREIH